MLSTVCWRRPYFPGANPTGHLMATFRTAIETSATPVDARDRWFKGKAKRIERQSLRQHPSAPRASSRLLPLPRCCRFLVQRGERGMQHEYAWGQLERGRTLGIGAPLEMPAASCVGERPRGEEPLAAVGKGERGCAMDHFYGGDEEGREGMCHGPLLWRRREKGERGWGMCRMLRCERDARGAWCENI